MQGLFGAGRNPSKYLDVAVSSFSKHIEKGWGLSCGALAAGRGGMFLCTNVQGESVLLDPPQGLGRVLRTHNLLYPDIFVFAVMPAAIFRRHRWTPGA